METLDRLIGELTEEIDVEPKRIIQAGFEKESRLEPVKPDLLTRGQRRRMAKERLESTAGAKWFDLPVKELEVEDKLTVDAIRLRETLDPIVEHPIDHYSSRATRKEKKQTLVDELIADAEFKKNVKQRYNRQRATDAIRKKERALAERRKLMQGKKKLMKQAPK